MQRMRAFTAAVCALLFCFSSPATAQEKGGLPSGDAPVASVRFTAWNLRNFLYLNTPPPPGSSSSTKKPEEVRAITAILTKLRPDVLGVCEMGSTEDLAILQARLREGGLNLPYSEHVRAADPVRHLALLSRFPIVERNSRTQLRYLLDSSQRPVERGILDVTVEVNSHYRLRLLGVHLKSRRDVQEADQELMRRNEAHVLRRYADQIILKAPETNLLIYGDFNESRDKASQRELRGTRGAGNFLSELPLSDESGERWTYHYPAADEYSRVDFLFANKGLLPEIIDRECGLYSGRDWLKASDHRALTAVIRTAGGSAPPAIPRSRTPGPDEQKISGNPAE